MDLVAASWCKQFNVISFLLLLQSATTLSLSCPAKCECTNFRDASFVECYNVSTLKTIPSGIPANARTLVFQHTQISKIQQNAFQGLPHVIEIEIQFNPLTTIERNAFQGLTKLNELVLKGNNINLLYRDSFRGIPQIRKIFLSKNNLQTLPEGLFDNTTNLELLELQNNQLSEFPLELLKNLTNLSILLLDNNLFTTIPYEAKEVLDKIAQKQHSTIGLSRNPLMCTQELKWLQTWIKLHPSVVEVDKVMCQTPFGNWSKVVTFNFSLLETNLWPTPGKINEHMTSPTPSLQTTYTSAFIELPVTSSAASLASAVVTSSIPSSPTSSPSLTTSSVTSSGKSNTITPTSSSTSNSASSTAVVTSPPETTETPNTSKKTDDVTTIFTTLESTEKSIPPETSDTVTAGSKVDVSTTSIEKESASKGKYLSRNQQVILSASLVSVCLIATVALAMYFFRKKVILRQKTINARLPGMMYDRVNTVSVVE
ncbi:SLIT and NTRK-like protein 4 isoform X2 [Stylophora pistillata]|uniref:Slit-like 3 protein n=1 Tax=Stylophora pistillata TaxID=50429 RepID=A0A2B4RNQ8_STYPI|nr:SLIT and NTRK-like protein 4 isoform X2 [Stylophora pistillata]PFX17968.1 Slit-like 3 protein [Stylophora pistillata]